MNVRQGMKRLALFAGVLGAIAGGIVTFVFLSDVLEQRARHHAFERLANSDIVQHQRKLLQADPYAPNGGHAVTEWDAQGNPIQQPGGPTAPASSNSDPWAVVKEERSDPFASIAKPLPTEVDKDGIKAINWTHNLGIESIDTEDGQTLYPQRSPGIWACLVPLFFPVLGFFVPWGLVSAVAWVGAGFAEKQKL